MKTQTQQSSPPRGSWWQWGMRCSAAAIALFLGFNLPSTAHAHDGPHDAKPATVQVNGSGTMAAAPDMATVSFGVIREARTAREALDANNKAMADVLAAMKELGIADKDLQTSGFNISPRYFYPKQRNNEPQKPPEIVGYQVSNQLAVRVRDLTKIGNVLDKSVTLGVNSGGSIQFSNEDTTEILRQARQKAVENAVDRAKTLVTAAGARLGKIISISESSHQPGPQPLARARAIAHSAAAESVPVETGENSYRVQVNVVWEIDQ